METATLKKTEEAPGIFPRYEVKRYDALYGMSHFSEDLLAAHFNLYAGYVANTNALIEEMSHARKEGEGSGIASVEARRRFGWEFNGMRLHEYYFENLGGNGALNVKSPLHRRLAEQFGSFESWKADFTAVGAMRGIGWAALYEDMRTGRLFNVWVEQHDAGHLAGGRPLLLLDAFEHAYLKDYGLDKKKYIQAFFMNVDWNAVIERSTEACPERL